MKYSSSIVFLFVSHFVFAQIPAPDFTVTDTDGIQHTLYQDYLDKGTTVVLKIFFVACPPCNSVAPDVQALYEEWGEGEYDVEFMELTNKAFDDDNDVIGFKNMHGLTFPGISADGGALEVVDTLTSGDWGPFFGTPSFYVIAPDGMVFSGLNFAGVNSAINASGAMGPGNVDPVTEFDINIHHASNTSSGILNVQTLITDKNDMSSATPINLLGYDSVEEIIEAFPNVQNPVVLFYKDDDAFNGISTIDISLITKHVLGITPFDQDYKLVAADVNRDDKVSAVDLSTLTKIVLGINPFPGDIWVFDPPYVELNLSPGNTITIGSSGIKIGDVN